KPPTDTTDPDAVNLATNDVTLVPKGRVIAILFPVITPADPFIENAVITGTDPFPKPAAVPLPPPLPTPQPFKINIQHISNKLNAIFKVLATLQFVKCITPLCLIFMINLHSPLTSSYFILNYGWHLYLQLMTF